MLARQTGIGVLLSLLAWGAILAVAPSWSAEIVGDPFMRPASLEPDIDFWRQIFSEIDSDHAFLHDSRHLNVIYETVRIPPGATARDRRRIADQKRDRYRKTLELLANGQRESLDAEQYRVLGLWPKDISSKELKEAARRIRFQQGLADRFREGLQRSGAWRPYIEEQLQTHDVPLGLAALPHVESSFNPEARSHVGASGLWQFTRSTGRRFMTIDHVVDDRRDPFSSSEAAAKLLAYNYSVLQSWPLAITAYNHGVGGMRRAVKKLGTEDIGVINRKYQSRTFGFASRNFYVAFLAALEVERNAEQYFGVLEFSPPTAYIEIKVPRYIPAKALASAIGVSASTLREHNPALLESVWQGTKHVPRKHVLRIPTALSDKTAEQIIAAIPATQRYASQTPDKYHKVRSGESLSVIAARYDASVSELVALNSLKSRHRIRIGQTLRLPFAGVAIPDGAATYKVHSGDSLSVIARNAGVTQMHLMELNSLQSRDRIYAGQTLYLASSAAAVKKVAATPTQHVQQVSIIADPVADLKYAPASANQMAVTAALSDPNDYEIAAGDSIEIHAGETLGHYADWLGVKTQRLRDMNGIAYGKPVVVGRRIKLDFARVGQQEFKARRIAWHRDVQDAFFVKHKVIATTEHKVKPGESLWVLMHQRYKVPVWLLQQYNPELDFGAVRPGMRVVFPTIETVEQEA